MSAPPAARSGRTTSPEAILAAAGLQPARARRRLQEVGLWGVDGPSPQTLALVAQLSDAASPEDALHVVADLAGQHPETFAVVRADKVWLQRLVAVAGASRPLGDLLARHPDVLDSLRHLEPVSAGQIAREVAEAVASCGRDEERASAVARIRRRTTAAIAARDLTGQATVDEVGFDLARLAEGVLTGALRALQRDLDGEQPAARLCVVGMGKLGGEELNYVSDVDVVFVHQPAPGVEEAAARGAAQRVWAGLLRLLNSSTTMGRAYEVDPTLRPEGPRGALSRTVAGFVSYWERWAETWEFQALLKARPVAGDLDLGVALLEAAERFVFPERLDPGAIADVRSIKGRVEAKREVLRAGDRQLKLGPGGLRDIEFAVQLLQLVHGRADRSLRERGTLPALQALAQGGYVAEADAQTFAAAYRLLRAVEHRLQLADERRTHTLPEDPGRLEKIARSLGYRPGRDHPARAPFLARIRAVQSDVRELHTKLFYRPLLEVHAAVPASDAALLAPDEPVRAGLPEDAALVRLEALGFGDARGALRDVRSLTAGVSRRAVTLRTMLPAMLHSLAESPDPDAGLTMLRTLVESHGSDPTLIASLRDQPPAADLLARLLGTSEVAGELLTNQPQGIEWLTDPESRAQPRTREELMRAALAQLGWQAGLHGRQATLRRFKRRELTRIVIRDVAGDAGVSVVGAELTALGEACLEAGLQAVVDQTVGDGSPPARVSIIGLGKLGGRELHYASDLDVMFVHQPVADHDESEVTAFAVEVAERVLKALSAVTAEGTAFDVDPELRPEGRSGPLSRSLHSCRVYYERWAQPWEHQALLKARHVAGDATVGRAFLEFATDHAYPPDFGPREQTAMRKMKARIERERLPRRRDEWRHLKLGAGGLTDVEWTVQLLQRRHGRREPLLRATSTMEALDALQDADVIESRDAQWLREGYRFLWSLRNRLYLLRQPDVDTMPSSQPLLEKLARCLGYGRGGWQTLHDDHLRVSRRIRRVTERLFYGQT